MANRAVAVITQNNAKRIFKAGRDAGFDAVKITLHPDGRLEASASFNDAAVNPDSENTWDKILK